MLRGIRIYFVGYEVLTELTELSSKGMRVLQNSQKLSGTSSTRVNAAGIQTSRLSFVGYGYVLKGTKFSRIL